MEDNFEILCKEFSHSMLLDFPSCAAELATARQSATQLAQSIYTRQLFSKENP